MLANKQTIEKVEAPQVPKNTEKAGLFPAPIIAVINWLQSHLATIREENVKIQAARNAGHSPVESERMAR